MANKTGISDVVKGFIWISIKIISVLVLAIVCYNIGQKDGRNECKSKSVATCNTTCETQGKIKHEPENKAEKKEKDIKPAETIVKPAESHNLGLGEIITMGSWRYEANGSARPIKWKIIDINKKENTAILLSDVAIENRVYHNKKENVTWSKSNIKYWLNNMFYNEAFTSEEKKRIIAVNNKNNTNKSKVTHAYIESWKRIGSYEAGDDRLIGERWNTRGGQNTTDKVWLLSIEDIEKYKISNDDKKLQATPYMKTQYNKYCSTEACKKNNIEGNCKWWLRSPGKNQQAAAYVNSDGFVNARGTSVDLKFAGIRAALKISLTGL